MDLPETDTSLKGQSPTIPPTNFSMHLIEKWLLRSDSFSAPDNMKLQYYIISLIICTTLFFKSNGKAYHKNC